MIENFRLISAKGNLIRPNITPNIGDSLFELLTTLSIKSILTTYRMD